VSLGRFMFGLFSTVCFCFSLHPRLRSESREAGDTRMYPPASDIQKKAIDLDRIEGCARHITSTDIHVDTGHQMRVDGCARASGRTSE
jgi:hypothetical protein